MTQRIISRIICVALGLLLGLATAPARGQGESLPKGANKLCPVMQDQPTKASRFVDHQGRRIYFCCDKCLAKFQKNPAKYVAVLDGVTLAPTTAPANDITPARAFTSRPWQLFGKLHVVVVHFPIALIILAGVIELLRVRKTTISDTAYMCVLFGAAATVVAALMGWVNAANAFDGSTTAPRTLALHRWSGVGLAAVACLIAIIMTVARRKTVAAPALLRASRFGALLCAGLVAIVGHFGGTLTYGEDYYTSIFRTKQPSLVASAAPRSQGASSTTAPADSMQAFLFGTAEEARMARIRMRLASLPPAPAPPEVQGHVANDVDRFIVAKWRDANLPEYQSPPALCDDATFVRRVYLDLIGVIPTIEQTQKFIDDKAADKRAKLIDELLDRDQDYAAHWTPFFEEAIASSPFDYQGSVGTHGNYQPWIIASFKENRPYDVMFAQLVDPTEPGYVKKPPLNVNGRNTYAAYIKNETHVETMQSAANVGQFFLGTGMKCASCHSHFLNDEWPQQRFLGFAGLFGEKDLELIRCEKKSDVMVPSQYALPVPGAPTDVPRTVDERLHYATRLTIDPANPRFAITAVNRLWRRYLGLGLFEPIDDYRLDSAPANRELLDWLARDFVEHGYDLKHTIRLILNSRTYQLKYDPKLEDHFDVANRDAPRYWRSPSLRKLTAEQAIDSIRVATAQKLDDRMRVYHRVESTALTRTLGRPPSRLEISTARPEDVAIVQALELLNGPEWYGMIYKSQLVAELVDEKDPAKLVDHAYRAVLARRPTDGERELAVEFVKESQVPAPTTAPAPEDIVWFDDAIPNGAMLDGFRGSRSWTFATSPEPVFSGEKSHVMTAKPNMGAQHFFLGAMPPIEIRSLGDVLYSYVYIDPQDPSREIMLQWHNGDWEHRAFWGADIIPFGSTGTPSRMNFGPLPKSGAWVRLEVTAKDIGLKPGDAVVGVSYDQNGGKVYWDKTGVELQPVPESAGVGDLLWALFTSPEFQYVR